MEINVSNIPLNTIYKFDVNKYIWTTMLTESRDGSIKHNNPVKYAEVYEITKEGYMKLLASGKLVHNKNNDGYSQGFAIEDYNEKSKTDFRITMYLREVTLRELYELRDAIAFNYKKMKKY